MIESPRSSAFSSGADELGIFARISVDPNVFSEVSILKTAYWFTDHQYLFIAKNLETGMFDVEFRPKEGESLDKLKHACGDFWNGVLDQEVRQKVIRETANVRDTLIKKAFFEAKAPLPTSVLSDESYLAHPGQ